MNSNLIISSLPLLFKGATTTLLLWLASALCSLAVGTGVGLLLSRPLRISWVSPILNWVTFVLRAVPLYVQLLIVYFVLPELMGVNLPLFCAAVVALSICSGAYVSQIVRAGTNAIATEQWHAAQVLGYSTVQAVRFVIVPQVVRVVLPALIGELDQLLKSTSLVSTLGMLELTRAGMNIVSREMNPITIYLTVAIIYLVLSSVLNGCGALLERRFSYANYY